MFNVSKANKKSKAQKDDFYSSTSDTMTIMQE